MNITRIRVREMASSTNCVNCRERVFNVVELLLNGITFSTYLHDGLTGDRTLKQAKIIADHTGADFEYDGVNAARVREVLGIRASLTPPEGIDDDRTTG